MNQFYLLEPYVDLMNLIAVFHRERSMSLIMCLMCVSVPDENNSLRKAKKIEVYKANYGKKR